MSSPRAWRERGGKGTTSCGHSPAVTRPRWRRRVPSLDKTSWQREQTVATRGPNGLMLVCDPSGVAGTDLFVFKTGM